MKDFLFLNYDWVPNSTYLFKCFEACGYECDYVNEQTLQNFVPRYKYRVVVAYLHEPWQLPLINHLRHTYLSNSYWVQHDDTDEEHVQQWFDTAPDLIIQREVTARTVNPYNKPLYPHHLINRKKLVSVIRLQGFVNPILPPPPPPLYRHLSNRI